MSRKVLRLSAEHCPNPTATLKGQLNAMLEIYLGSKAWVSHL